MLDMLGPKDGSAVGRFGALEDEFAACQLSFGNVLGYASDNANVVAGCNHSVKTLLKDKQPNLWSVGCVPHSAALIASKAFEAVPTFAIAEEMMKDIYNHFSHSYVRVEDLEMVQRLQVGWAEGERAAHRVGQSVHVFFVCI